MGGTETEPTVGFLVHPPITAKLQNTANRTERRFRVDESLALIGGSAAATLQDIRHRR